MPAPYKSATSLLNELGIADPDDIDIEAIAQYCKATVVYEPLHGCEARILGNGERAIITVNSRSQRPRQRFSAGHELGHWMRDRNKVGFSCTEVALRDWNSDNPERYANAYAADLLLPRGMFEPLAKNKPATFETVRELAEEFNTSLTATAIRLVEFGSFPAMLVFLENGKRKWFFRGPDVPAALWPRESPKPATVTYDLLRGNLAEDDPVPVQADGWLEHPRSRWYEILEHAIQIGPDAVLVLLWWKNEKQLLDLSEDED
jgi:hypothetical protein